MLFVDMYIHRIYGELLEWVSKFSKTSEYKFDIEKSIIFTYTYNKY